jgi:hypothetical protein
MWEAKVLPFRSAFESNLIIQITEGCNHGRDPLGIQQPAGFHNVHVSSARAEDWRLNAEC